TELLEAASSSKILKAKSSSGFSMPSWLIFLARIRAQVVFPTPLGPQNSKACARWLLSMALSRVLVMACCPTTSLNVWGRYLRAETTNYSIEKSLRHKDKNCAHILGGEKGILAGVVNKALGIKE